MRALVIGGGIGGVTAAHSLRQAGIDVDVFERIESSASTSASWTRQDTTRSSG